MRQWEYTQIVCPLGTELGQCQEMGEQGWELVSMAHVNVAPSALTIAGQLPAQMGWLLMFKRWKTPEATVAVSANGSIHGQNRLQ